MHAYVHPHPIDFTWDCPNNVLDLWSTVHVAASSRIIKCAMQPDRFETSFRYVVLYRGEWKENYEDMKVNTIGKYQILLSDFTLST